MECTREHEACSPWWKGGHTAANQPNPPKDTLCTCRPVEHENMKSTNLNEITRKHRKHATLFSHNDDRVEVAVVAGSVQRRGPSCRYRRQICPHLQQCLHSRRATLMQQKKAGHARGGSIQYNQNLSPQLLLPAGSRIIHAAKNVCMHIPRQVLLPELGQRKRTPALLLLFSHLVRRPV